MWIYDNVEKRWKVKSNSLDTETFRAAETDKKLLRYYSRCLDSSTYTYSTNFDDLYPRLTNNLDTWSIDYSNKTYSRYTSTTINPYTDSFGKDKFDQFLTEECFTIKNTFEPYKLINTKLNYNEIDFATTEQLESFDSVDLVIDNFNLKKDHTVLVKDQKTEITLDISIDPDTYFPYNYYIKDKNDTTVTYFYYNTENGIYKYDGSRLVRQDTFLEYQSDYSVVIKRGNINFDKQFFLSRRKDGYFPIENQELEFLNGTNFFTRNVLKYKNILDNNYYDFIIDNEYNRKVYVGEFGSILVEQDNNTNIIDNDFKTTLYSIGQTESNYIIVGELGTILILDKTNLKVKRYEIENTRLFNFKSVNFLDNLNGIIVGSFNSILHSKDGGLTWKFIDYPELKGNNYNSVVSINYNTIIVGDNGIVLHFDYKSLTYTKTDLFKIEDNDESFPFYANIYNISESYSLNNYRNGENFVLLSCDSTVIMYFYSSKTCIVIGQKNLTMLGYNSQVIGKINSSFLDSNTIYVLTDYTLYNSTLSNVISDSNIIPVIFNSGLSFDFKTNLIEKIDNNEYIVLCDESKILTTDLIVYNEVDPDLFNPTLKVNDPKLLFMDYDMGSKMIFFNKNYEYILPDRKEIVNTSFSSIDFSSISGETSWIDYYKDFYKQFDFISSSNFDDSNTIYFNTSFTQTSQTYYTIDNSNFGYYTTNATADFYLNDTVLKITNPPISMNTGDVLEISSVSLKPARFIVINETGTTFYIKTYFNDSIIDLLSEDLQNPLNTIKIINTNLYTTIDDLKDNLSKHYIGDAYRIVKEVKNNVSKYYITALYNNTTAYYNLQANIITNFENLDLKYKDLFIDFGYGPTYNILDFLSNINSVFTPSYSFDILPSWTLVYNTDFTINKNLIVLTDQFIYDTYFENTFIEIGSTKALIVKKYQSNNQFILETDQLLPSVTGTVTIRTRNRLDEISYDLQTLNNIHKPIVTENNITKYASEVTFKFSTENYCKALLSDRTIKDNLTGIVYTDNNYNLSLNMIKLKSIVRKDVQAIRSTYNKLEIVLNDYTDLTQFNTGDLVRLVLEDKQTGINTFEKASMFNNLITIAQLNTSDPSNISIETYIDYPSIDPEVSPGVYTGYIEKVVSDPYLLYSPIDILMIGKDYKHKPLIQLKSENYVLNGNKYSLKNVDFTRYRFQLINTINIVDILTRYPWILEAEIENGVIGFDNNTIQFYDGVWSFGRWFEGDFYKGTIYNMQFYSGNMYSVNTSYTILSASANLKQSNSNNTIWYNGDFYSGTINDITWYNGRHYSGITNRIEWYGGIFDNGIWDGGNFYNGVWVTGQFNSGNFESRFGNSIWIDGEFSGGNFVSGNWLNGKFYQTENSISRFGTNPNNSRKAIWESGNWIKGEFHSILRLENDKPVYSLNNRYSIFKTGIWSDGIFYGGTINHILWKNGIIENGIVTGLNPISIESEHPLYTLNDFETVFPDKEGSFDYTNTTKKFLLFNDILRLDLSNPFYIIDNNLSDNTITQNTLGTNQSIGKHLIQDIQLNYDTNQSLVEIVDSKTFNYNYTNSDIFGIEEDIADFGSELQLVPRFENVIVKRGIIENAYIINTNWYGGMLINGLVENANWNLNI